MTSSSCDMKKNRAIDRLLATMAKLRAPDGCPWDREQTHQTIGWHAVEEVYELLDAIEARDDHEMAEELGDLLLQVVFHCQLAQERGAFDFATVAQRLVDKLIRRHPHVFGDSQTKTVAAIWAQWERIKKAEKQGTRHDRPSALDGIPRHLPALLRAEKLIKKARKAGLLDPAAPAANQRKLSKSVLAKELFYLTRAAHTRGWSAEALLHTETQKAEKRWRREEARRAARQPPK
jgi:uncharacterized protein YabN with tetrapyrrole methylase and pyrophosphatase domain